MQCQYIIQRYSALPINKEPRLQRLPDYHFIAVGILKISNYT